MDDNRKFFAAKTTSTNSSCPASTPKVKNSNAALIAFCGSPISDKALANPTPCSSPNRKAIAQGCSLVKLCLPCLRCTASAATKTIESAISASITKTGNVIKPSDDIANVIDFMLLWTNGECESEFRSFGSQSQGVPFKFMVRDPDGFLPNGGWNHDHAVTHNGPLNAMTRLRSSGNPDYAILLADRIHKHFFNDGALTAEQAAARSAAGIINTLKQITLAKMIASQSKFGVPGIIAAAAGFGLVESLFRRIGRGGGRSSGGGGASIDRISSVGGRDYGQRIEITGTLKGRDIELQGVEQDRVTSRTKANG